MEACCAISTFRLRHKKPASTASNRFPDIVERRVRHGVAANPDHLLSQRPGVASTPPCGQRLLLRSSIGWCLSRQARLQRSVMDHVGGCKQTETIGMGGKHIHGAIQIPEPSAPFPLSSELRMDSSLFMEVGDRRHKTPLRSPHVVIPNLYSSPSSFCSDECN